MVAVTARPTVATSACRSGIRLTLANAASLNDSVQMALFELLGRAGDRLTGNLLRLGPVSPAGSRTLREVATCKILGRLVLLH